MRRRGELFCACGHQQSFHDRGFARCRCGCDAFRRRDRRRTITVLACIDLGNPPYVAPSYSVRCPSCEKVYETKGWLRDIIVRRSCRECADLRRVARRGPRAPAPADLPTSERYQHGTRAKYVASCRCEPCTAANREYARLRSKLPPNPLVPASRVRQHLERLSARGIGRRSIADVAKVSVTSLSDIKRGTKTQLRKATADRILACRFEDCVDDKHSVDAAKTQRLIEKLLAMGFTRSQLARQLGSKAKTPALQIGREKVSAKNARKVQRLFEAHR